MVTRTVCPRISRQDLVVNLLDQAVLVSTLFREFWQFRGDMPEEIAIFERWDELAEAYLVGLRQLREQAITSVWPER